MIFYICLFVAVFAVVSHACDDALCNHPDQGSCGNACCKLSFQLALPTEKVMSALNTTIHTNGGPDGLWTPQMTAEGTSGIADLRPYNAPVDFIGQAFHQTKNGLYTDTINFTIAPVAKSDSSEPMSQIQAFSLSQIGGAYGDDGQNFYNIVSLIQGAFPDAQPRHIDNSCPVQDAK
eukprot:GSChrysophyteH1.ASY1.ANO1.1082.1 assembled CDS